MDIVLVLAAVLYFVPGVVATMRGHPNAVAISVLNLFLGWTFIGWVAALVWACTAIPAKAGEKPDRSTPSS